MRYATGVRISQLLSINICDIDRESEMVKVMGKGGRIKTGGTRGRGQNNPKGNSIKK